MKKIGKKYKSAKEAIPAEKQSKSEAISLCKNNAPANFDESVDIAFSLGIDPKDAEQNIRTTCLLYTSPSPRDRIRSRMPSSA